MPPLPGSIILFKLARREHTPGTHGTQTANLARNYGSGKSLNSKLNGTSRVSVGISQASFSGLPIRLPRGGSFSNLNTNVDSSPLPPMPNPLARMNLLSP